MWLPAHHVPRPRLTERCSDHRVVVAEAAGGYGKSVLAAELVDSWSSVGIVVQLEHGDVPGSLFLARLREATQRAGFTDAAAAVGAQQDPVAGMDTLVVTLAGERCTFVIDDAHHASADTAQLIDRLATRVESSQRLVVLARQLPEGAGRLRRAEYLHLSATDLALESDETLAICRDGFGLDVTSEEARALNLATGGWTAAAVLAAARATRQGTGLRLAGETGWAAIPAGGALGVMLDEALNSLDQGARSLLVQVGRLPLLDADLVRAVVGESAVFETWLRVGLPFARSGDRWWSLPGPVRDHLASIDPGNQDFIRRAAPEYGRRGELGVGLDLLMSIGDFTGAAAMMASIAPDVEETIDTFQLRAHFDQLPNSAVEDHPKVLILIARRLGHASLWAECRELVEWAGAIARRTGDDQLARAATAEMIKVSLLAEMKYAEAIDEARRLLDELGSSEQLVRARASEFLGYALCYLRDEAGGREVSDLIEAEHYFARASALYRTLGMRSAASFVAVDWAVHVEFPQGRLAAALARIEEALDLIGDRPRARAFVLIWKALFAAELGQDELCRVVGSEAMRLAGWIKSGYLAAEAHWKLAISASYSGDAVSTLEHLRAVEQQTKVWWHLLSAEFLAESADLVDRVGHHDLALQYLARAEAEPKDAGHLVALSDAVIEARHGDPARATLKLRALTAGRMEEREQWRVTLLQAFAAFRSGADEAAGLAARAFEEAARIGQPQAPLIRERTVAEQLLPLAIGTGHPAALAIHVTELPTSLSLLGRFELTVGGRPVRLSHGQEARLLKFVAIRGGRVHVDETIDALWPDADGESGRNRLRTVLHRLRSAAGPILGRSGELLSLGEGLAVDLYQFEIEAARAQKLASEYPAVASSVAGAAMAHYRGDLLPEDLYESWTELVRDRVRHTMVALLELCARAAIQRGDLDDLRRIVEQSIEFNPYNDALYVQVATAFVSQGRRGEAMSVVARARAALRQIAVAAPPALLELESLLLDGRETRPSWHRV